MALYVGWRLLLMIPLLAGLATIVFFYLRVIPGDPISAMLGAEGSDVLADQLRARFGLDQPLLTQYANWISGLPRGELGVSYRSQQPIADILLARLPATAVLVLGGTFLMLLLAVPLGLIAGIKRGTALDYAFSVISLVGLSTPTFWVATLLVFVVALNWRLLPSQGYVALIEDPGAGLTRLLLPALALGLTRAPYIARMTRAAVIEVMQEPYVRFAHAKGLRERTILWRYIIRSAAAPVAVVVGLQFGNLLGGTIVVEEFFNWPGIGRLMIRGIIERDYFVVQGVLLYFATLVLVLNLAVEVLQGWLDPRIRLR